MSGMGAKGRLRRQTFSFRRPSIIFLTSFSVLIHGFVDKPALFLPRPSAPAGVSSVLGTLKTREKTVLFYTIGTT
jgi:hypothetical protein